jgi:hypothetical protein
MPGICSQAEVIISLGFELPRTSSDLPEDLGRASRSSALRRKPTDVFLFGLASGNAYRAGDVTTTAVGSYPTVSPLPEPRWPDRNPVALAIGGLFSVVLVSDRSAWELPSALPMKSGLSSRRVSATSDHPAFSLAPEHYRAARGALSRALCTRFDLLHARQERRGNRLPGLVNCHRLRHPFFQLVDAGLMARVCGHKF